MQCTDGLGDPEKASSWLEGNERVYQVMQCTDGTQGNKHTEQFPVTDGEGQSHSNHNHYAAEKLTLCIGFQS